MNRPAVTEDRVAPQSLDAETSVLGAILTHGELIADAAEHLQPAHFFRLAHGIIFDHMLRLAAAQKPIDFLTVKESLQATRQLEDIGGPAYLAGLCDGVPRASNIGEYAEIVRARFRQRQIIAAATKLLSEAYDADEDARDVLDRAEQTLFELGQGEVRSDFKRLSAILPGLMDQIEAWCSTKQGITGVPSGFLDLDDMTRGFQPGNLILLAARPSMGKSGLALNIAQHVAGLGKTVGIFSLEMSETELAVRTLTAEAEIDGHRLQRGRVRESEWGRLSQAMQTLGGLNLYIDESPFITVFEMRSRARRLKAAQGLDLLIVDYTQLMIGTERRENRTLELGAISRALKALAKDLKIPIIALSQLSRKVEERTDKRPMLSDLRESGALEQDADLVLFIYRESVYHETPENLRRAEIIIGKQRNGPIGTVTLGWMPEQTKFVNFTDLSSAADQRLPMGDR